MNAIELNDFSVKYGDFTAVDNISFASWSNFLTTWKLMKKYIKLLKK